MHTAMPEPILDERHLLRIGDEALPETCALCKFWQRDRAQRIEVPKPVNGTATEKITVAIAPCRRFPPLAALRTHLQKQFTPQGLAMVPTQIAESLPHVATAANDWCGEFQLETRAAQFRGDRANPGT